MRSVQLSGFRSEQSLISSRKSAATCAAELLLRWVFVRDYIPYEKSNVEPAALPGHAPFRRNSPNLLVFPSGKNFALWDGVAETGEALSPCRSPSRWSYLRIGYYTPYAERILSHSADETKKRSPVCDGNGKILRCFLNKGNRSLSNRKVL